MYVRSAEHHGASYTAPGYGGALLDQTIRRQRGETGTCHSVSRKGFRTTVKLFLNQVEFLAFAGEKLSQN